MKHSVSLSDSCSEVLGELSTRADATPSTVIETAIRLLSLLPDSAFNQAINETLDSKKAATPNGWRKVFWRAMTELFGFPPNTFAFDADRPFGPRVFEGVNVVFLASGTEAKDFDSLLVHAFGLPSSDADAFVAKTWNYNLSDSAHGAARVTAAWIRELTSKGHKQRLQRQCVTRSKPQMLRVSEST